MPSDLDTPEKVLEAAARECEASRCPEEALAERGQRGWMWGQHIEAAWRQAGQDCAKRIRALRSRVPAPATAPGRTIAVCGSCDCGIGYIDVPDSIDSGATFYCVQCAKPIVFDVSSPESRAEMYARLDSPRAELDVDALVRGICDALRYSHTGPNSRKIAAAIARQRSEEKP